MYSSIVLSTSCCWAIQIPFHCSICVPVFSFERCGTEGCYQVGRGEFRFIHQYPVWLRHWATAAIIQGSSLLLVGPLPRWRLKLCSAFRRGVGAPLTIWGESESVSRSVLSNSLWPHGLQPARLSPRNSPGKNVGVSGLPFPSPGDPPNPGIKFVSPAL